MTKEQLREKCKEQGIEFTEKDSVDELKGKLGMANLPAKVDGSLPFTLFDAEDDQQVLAELQGAVLDKFVYKFEQQGKTIIGLSKAGVEQACRFSADKKGEVYRIIGEPQVTTEGEYYLVKVQAGRYKLLFDRKGNYKGEALLDTAWGSKRQWKKMRVRNQNGSQIVDDNFSFEKAMSKAQRNAKMSLLPYVFITELVKQFTDSGNVQTLRADQTIGDAQIRYLHTLANHEELAKVVKAEFGYDHLNQLKMAEMHRVSQILTEKKQAIPEIPYALLALLNAQGVMPAKRDAVWKVAIKQSNGDVQKAGDIMKATLLPKEKK